MARGKCPPGVFCIENITLTLVGIIILTLGIILYNTIINHFKKQDVERNDKNEVYEGRHNYGGVKRNTEQQSFMQRMFSGSASLSPFYNNPNTIFSNRQNDTLMNPYAPPLKDNRFISQGYTTVGPPLVAGQTFGGDIRGPVAIPNNVPITISTQGAPADFRQVGLLTRSDGSETILPLFGRPLYNNRNKWQYYASKENNNMIKLPISKNGRSCMNEYGCDELFNGDTLFVEGYKDSFSATIYETNHMYY